MNETKVGFGLGCFGLIAVVALFIFWQSMASVDVGYVGVLDNYGSLGAELDPGFHLKTPFVQGIRQVDVRTQKSEVKAEAASKDLQTVDATLAINYRIDPAHVKDVLKNVSGSAADTILSPAIQEAFKATTAQYAASELITDRENVRIKAKEALRSIVTSRFIIVEELNIINFSFSKEFEAAIEASQTAKQNVVEAEQKLRQVEVDAQQKVKQAEADAQATRLRADAEAYAQQKQVQALSPLYVEYIKWSKWNGQLPSTELGTGSGVFITPK